MKPRVFIQSPKVNKTEFGNFAICLMIFENALRGKFQKINYTDLQVLNMINLTSVIHSNKLDAHSFERLINHIIFL